MKIYIAGKITGLDTFRENFAEAQTKLETEGHSVMNPAVLPKGFEHREYMHICYAMIDVCDTVFMLDNWTDSIGAAMEHEYAIRTHKKLTYQRSQGQQLEK